MDRKVKSYIKEQDLLQTGDRVVLGVSGGPDSISLLHILAALRIELGIEMVVAHLNHGLRPQGDQEQDYVRQVCLELSIPFYSQHRDIKKLASNKKKSLEETGREERYQYFREICTITGAMRIATAHHQDDTAETVLLHLLRGSGIRGLRGIMPRKGNLIRPLLCVSKKEILDYLHQHNINYWVDHSNEDLCYMRNRIRHKLLPILRNDFNPQIAANLNQLADIAREENRWLEDLAFADFTAIGHESEDGDVVAFKTSELFKRPVAAQRRLLFLALSRLGGESGWVMADVELIRQLEHKTGSARILQLKKGIFARKVYDKLILSRARPSSSPFSYRINSIPGQLIISEIGEQFYFDLDGSPDSGQEGSLFLDYDRLREQTLYLRSRLPGDRIRLPGGSKKIKEYFIDRKLPWEQRDLVPLLASEHEILAIMGFCVSEQVRVSSETRSILMVKKMLAEP